MVEQSRSNVETALETSSAAQAIISLASEAELYAATRAAACALNGSNPFHRSVATSRCVCAETDSSVRTRVATGVRTKRIEVIATPTPWYDWLQAQLTGSSTVLC